MVKSKFPWPSLNRERYRVLWYPLPLIIYHMATATEALKPCISCKLALAHNLMSYLIHTSIQSSLLDPPSHACAAPPHAEGRELGSNKVSTWSHFSGMPIRCICKLVERQSELRMRSIQLNFEGLGIGKYVISLPRYHWTYTDLLSVSSSHPSWSL